ncbi:geranylgeranylglyceryl/heptaprenylglyceryl phosphate synthase [Limibacter armeniacum]|uniref:geranylgeranylglyceryl/heptaprenylglyceryl phosphate synthase n=1 Tax=Limibacter armeniacum TaxID=466084 RepID=UPI002FE55E3A
MNLHTCIAERKAQKLKTIAVLIDPDKTSPEQCIKIANSISDEMPVIFLVGGSLISNGSLSATIQALKSASSLPVILFPGGVTHICEEADGILLLSLISGRNADFLIGQHVTAAPILKKSGMEVISTGYVLVDGGVPTSVSYMSNTTPVPANKTDIAACTAMAGEMLGLKMIYLEAGSGAQEPVNIEMVKAVRESIAIPLIVGGGIRSAAQASDAFNAGADMIVVGTAIEENQEFLYALLDLTATVNAVQ